MDYLARARQLQDDIVDLRRDFHRHPELSFQETRTSQAVCDQLDRLQIPYVLLQENCVVGRIVGGQANEGARRIAIRPDMDALPVQEQTALPFQSGTAGVMHACGHDGHMAMLLGAAALLKEAEATLHGEVFLCFQSAEEIAGGAQTIIDYLHAEGGVDRCIAAHLWADLNSGLISVVEGARMASGDLFTVEVSGRGGHAARPDLSIDPIKPMAQIVLALSAIPTNRVETIEPCVVHIGRIEAGTAYNIFPEKATIWGGFRTFSERNRRRVPELIREVAENTARAYGATAQVEILQGVPMVYNEAAAVALAQELLKEHPILTPDAFEPICASENFGLYLEQFGGFMCYIGIRNEAKGLIHTQHHPKFDIDEDVLYRGAAFFAQYAEAFLAGR